MHFLWLEFCKEIEKSCWPPVASHLSWYFHTSQIVRFCSGQSCFLDCLFCHWAMVWWATGASHRTGGNQPLHPPLIACLTIHSYLHQTGWRRDLFSLRYLQLHLCWTSSKNRMKMPCGDCFRLSHASTDDVDGSLLPSYLLLHQQEMVRAQEEIANRPILLACLDIVDCLSWTLEEAELLQVKLLIYSFSQQTGVHSLFGDLASSNLG